MPVAIYCRPNDKHFFLILRRSSDVGGSRDHHHHHHVQPSTKPSIVASSSPTPRMMSPELYNQLRGLQRNARDLRQEVKVLRRLTQLQSMAMKDLVQDTYLKLREACIAFSTSRQPGVDALNGGPGSMSAADLEQWRLAQGNNVCANMLFYYAKITFTILLNFLEWVIFIL